MSINQTFKLSLTALCTALLVACSGGGGSGDGDNNSNTATPINNEATPVNTNTNTNTGNNQNSSTGQIAKIGVDDAGITISDLNSSDFDSITVDGKTIQVVRPGYFANGWSNITEGNITTNICCGKYDSAKIGFYELGENEASYLFYDGKVTDKNQIPQSGVFSYKGDSLIFPGDDALPDEIKGSTNLTADFNNKTLTGNLSGTGINITVNANINQNEFSGSATSSVDPGTAAVQGKFYGDNAKQLAGMAIPKTDDVEWGAGFIAAKQ